ncbi:hypothetical protein EVAR_39321_1 [Eumeta japonica]|uniref:Uncharacterized protein n=1 Tax=Eumeta variegata TaxID=151549 RepID=A0A4C1VWU6_EUMVA|nr:hypothetical protein EVAR_39321_1 [Eumeta japonica]
MTDALTSKVHAPAARAVRRSQLAITRNETSVIPMKHNSVTTVKFENGFAASRYNFSCDRRATCARPKGGPDAVCARNVSRLRNAPLAAL